MKRQFVLATFMSLLGVPFTPAFSAVTGSKNLPDAHRVQSAGDGGVLRIQVSGDDVVRVTHDHSAELRW
jgi:hypothetical protein